MKSKCCNEELLTIYLDGAQQGLGHPYCSKCGKVDRVMTTTPQLSKELEKAFDEKFKHDFRDGGSSSCYGGKDCDCWVKDAKQFLAQALQDQREGFVKEVEMMELSGRGEEYRLAQDHIIDILKGKTK